MKRMVILTALGAVLGVVLLGYHLWGSAPQLQGGGSPFVLPLMSRWAAEYDKTRGVKVNYQSIGSGGGLARLRERTFDFGCADSRLSGELLRKTCAGGEVVQVPLVLGAVVPVYNLEEAKAPLRFSGPVLADIFLGNIKHWDDKALRDLNPGVSLPGRPIVVVHRSDASGTTALWTEYLARVSSSWKAYVGAGATVYWPVGRGQKG